MNHFCVKFISRPFLAVVFGAQVLGTFCGTLSAPQAFAAGCSEEAQTEFYGQLRRYISVHAVGLGVDDEVPQAMDPASRKAIETRLREMLTVTGSRECFQNHILTACTDLIRYEINSARHATDRIPVHVDGGVIYPKFSVGLKEWFSLFGEHFPSMYYSILNRLEIRRIPEIEAIANAKLTEFFTTGTRKEEIKRVSEEIEIALRATKFLVRDIPFYQIIKSVPRLTSPAARHYAESSSISGIQASEDAITFAPLAIQAWNETPLRQLRPKVADFFDEQARLTRQYVETLESLSTRQSRFPDRAEDSELAQKMVEVLYPGLVFDLRTLILTEDSGAHELFDKALAAVNRSELTLNQVVLLMIERVTRSNPEAIVSLKSYFDGLNNPAIEGQTSTQFAVYYLNLPARGAYNLSKELREKVQTAWERVLDQLYAAGGVREAGLNFYTYSDRIERNGLESRYKLNDIGQLKKNFLVVELCDRFLKKIAN